MKSSPSTLKFDNNNDDDVDDEEESHISWSNIIFLPFNSVFQMFVLISVILKSILGPVKSIFSIVHCSEVMDKYLVLTFVKYYYWYFCDLIYFADTFLHIVHRQVTDKAMRREFLPKSAFLLLIDVLSLVPFYTIATSELCPPVQLWPNVLAFSEFFVIYRIVEHFSMVSTHSILKLVIGFTLLVIICINCIGCFVILLTVHGLCEKCPEHRFYDWRKYVMHKLNETDESFTTYVYGTSLVVSFIFNTLHDETKPSTIIEYVLSCLLMLAGFFLNIYIVMPKIFAESVLNLRRICNYQPTVQKITDETKRRNPSPTAYISVRNFYHLIWRKRKGITHMPAVIGDFPRYLRLEVKQDLIWPVFYHSPTLRNTSASFKRWLCEFITLDYKLPGEKFYAGPHCHTNLYYLKSGIIEILSADDGITPLLSLSGGTLLGDVSCLVPPLKRNLVVRCVTYCEVFIVSRYDILKAMQKYPADRKDIMSSVNERIKHARTLYNCKQHVRGLDRAEDEGIAWIKRRWWEISEAVSTWKNSSKVPTNFVLPPEEAVYHCAKYIGQLVLCSDVQLHQKSLFTKTNFPWILAPDSPFICVWKYIVFYTVLLAFIIYPPNITGKNIQSSFKVVQIWVDFIYVADICITLSTSTKRDNLSENFATVMFTRCKSVQFVIDVFATIWIEILALLAGRPELYYVFQFNRLLKVYILFTSDIVNEWNLNRGLLYNVCYKVMLASVCYFYISAHVIYVIKNYVPNLTPSTFFGEKYCTQGNQTVLCDVEGYDVAIAHIYELLFFEFPPRTLADNYFCGIILYVGYLINKITRGRFISYLYLKQIVTTNYQSFVTNLKSYYNRYKIHEDLMRRLDRYLICQWKYYKGRDVMQQNIVQNEPFDIYWKVHGEVAEKVIRNSQAFAGADPMLIRELAYVAKFMILPKDATIFLFGVQCRNVTWIVQGHVRCEYHDEEGQLVRSYHDPGRMISLSSVLLRRPSFRTYTSCTECELLYIQIQDFFNIIKRYPCEWSYFENCINEFGPVFGDMFESYLKKHEDYHKTLRKRIFHARRSTMPSKGERSAPVKNVDWTSTTARTSDSWFEPDSNWMYYWMLFRAIMVIVSIVSTSLQGSIGAPFRRSLMITSAFCDGIAWMDIVLKCFVSYYNDKGILIYDTKMCVAHYLTRGFFLDIVGAVPWSIILSLITTRPIYEPQAMLMNTFCKFAHLYIIMAFFNHIADKPSINSIYILIVKWQLMIVLVMIGASHFLMTHCIDFKFTDDGHLISMRLRNDCWMPSYFAMNQNLSMDELKFIFAQSLNLAQSALMRMNLGKFHVDRNNLGVGVILVLLGVTFWCVMCYSLTLLVLSAREDTLYQHGVNQLQNFLRAERVDKKLINKATATFAYWWKRTFRALDTLLKGGRSLERQLSSISQLQYFRPGEEVMREMDLTPFVFAVHRGQVIIKKNGEKLVELTKGSIFGQLDGTKPRPVKVSAIADGYADVLQMSVGQFQDMISDDVRRNIAENRQSKHDYMAVKEIVKADPYDTIEYILRGRKTLQLPWMKQPIKAHNQSWYSRWLFLNWVAIPFVCAVLVLLLGFVPEEMKDVISWALLGMDVIFFAHFISEFFTIELAVVDGELVKRRLAHRLFLYWGFYLDFLSLLMPFVALINNEMAYQLPRLLRLRLLYEFYVHFCSSFQSKMTLVLMKILIVLLLIHSMVCGWIYVACRRPPGASFPVPLWEIPPAENASKLDDNEWVSPKDRAGGCARLTMFFKSNKTYGDHVSFLVPRKWEHDYLVGLLYILLLLTHTDMDVVVTLRLQEVYYKLFINAFILLMFMWLASWAIDAVYTMYRELYKYEYNVSSLTTYLHHSGLAPTLLTSIKEYSRQLWQRERGNWLPELAQQAPLCLREDLLGALYIHHLNRPVLFRTLPPYFTRQLVARFQRIVIFPGKFIVQEGDIFPCIYFIHEGEVEKWYTDASGEKKFMSLLTTNGYFGLIPGLFPSVPFQFSYYSRTVVDMVYLRLHSWQDLLTAYPDVRQELYTRAKQVKREK